MFLSKTIRLSTLASFFLCGTASYSQTPEDTLRAANLEMDELAPLPVPPPIEFLRAIAPLPHVANPGECPGIWNNTAKTKESIVRFHTHGVWPIHIECQGGTQYWGEIAEIGENSFELSNRETDEKTNLNYAGVKSVEVVKAYGVVGKYSLAKADLLQFASGQPQLSQESSYKIAVEKFGVNKHRFLRCELKSGRSHTGVVQEIREDRFLLKDGIFAERWISYTQLKSSPRAVQAVGPRIGQGFKWVGLALVTIPLLPFAPLFWDGC